MTIIEIETPRCRTRAVVCMLGVVLAGILLLPQPALAGNAVTRWIERALQTVRVQNIGTPDASRVYAMVSVAIYDAVNGIDTARQRGYEHALVPADGAPVNGDRAAAAVAAAHTVLRALAPAHAPVLDPALAAELAVLGATDPSVVAGRQWGQFVGERVLAIRSVNGSLDGTQFPMNLPAGAGIGEHRAPFDARWRNMTPFGIASRTPYISGPPPPLTSAEYAAAFNDVKTCGSNSPDLDSLCNDPTSAEERNEISYFWLAEARTVRETGTWLQAALSIVEQKRTVRSLSATARLFAQICTAIADAVTVVWEIKATHFTWRPFFAIREAGADGNPDTAPDANWVPRNISIGGSPEYNSGTSAFAGAASAVIETFYSRDGNDDGDGNGDDNGDDDGDDDGIGFCFKTDLAPRARCYANPLQAAEEAGRSRIFQGIHFQFSNEDGRRLGRAIGREIGTTRLQRRQ